MAEKTFVKTLRASFCQERWATSYLGSRKEVESNMKIFRGIMAGIAFGIIGEIFGFLVYGVLFMQWVSEAHQVWRPMDSLQVRIGMPLADIFGGLMVALAFAILYKGIPGTGIKKGLIFGLILWLITRLAGEIFFYVMSPIPFMLVVAGWLHGLIQGALGGSVIAAIYGKSLEGK